MRSSAFILVVLTATSGTYAQNPPSPTHHAPETMRVDGMHYELAHLENIGADSVTIVHQFGRAGARWQDLDPNVQQEYAIEHGAAVEATRPPALVAKPSPKVPAPAASPQPSAGRDIKFSDGTVFHDAVITASDASYITIRHRNGITRVDLATVPVDDRLKLAPRYDPQAAEAFKAAEAKTLEADSRAKEFEATMSRFDACALNFHGRITQIVKDGAIIKGEGRTDDKTTEIMVHGAAMKVSTERGREESYESVFIVGAGDGSVDGDYWSGRVWPAGRYQYTTVMGAVRTIPRFATNRDVALRLLGSSE